MKPIFIVGVPRSGTTLLAAMLGAHSRLSCGPETHFFSKDIYRRLLSRRVMQSWPDRAVDALFAGMYNNWTLAEAYGLSREQLADYLRPRQPSIPNALAALTEQFMHRMGKQRWVEKTPRHLLHVREIHKYFPRAPVIRIVRDPRDTALSILKAPWQFHSFLEALLYWQYLDARSAHLYEANPHTFTVRYEDLVEHPEQELRKICAFIGEDYEPKMLDMSESARQVNRIQEPWKKKVHEQIDNSRINVWRRELRDVEKAQAEALVGDRLRAFGYPTETRFERYVAVFPMFVLACYPDLVADAVTRRIRFWAAAEGERPEEKLYVGHPEADNWLGYTSRQRLSQTLSIAADVLRTRLCGQPFRWVNDWGASQTSGYCGLLLSFILRGGRRANQNWLLGTREPINAWL